MAAFSSLTTDQQNQIIAFMQVFRPTIGQTARASNKVVTMLQVWTNVIQPIISTLDSGTVIPDNTNLAGAVSLTSDEVTALMGGFASYVSTFVTPANVTAWTQAAGIANVTG